MLLVVGGDSEIGAAAAHRLRETGAEVSATTRRRSGGASASHFLDLTARAGDWHLPAHITGACLCAAIARLSDCAADPVRSRFVNVAQTIALTDRLTEVGSYVLFLSSNQVFDGTQPLVAATAERCPASEYGRQKAAAEVLLAQRIAAGRSIGILRLGKVIAPGMRLLADWHDALRASRPVRAFSDMRMAPVQIGVVAAAIAGLLSARAVGVYQLTGPHDVTYLETARHIAARIGRPESLVEAVPAASIGLPEGATPQHTTLDTRLLRDMLGITVPDAWDVIEQAVPGASWR